MSTDTCQSETADTTPDGVADGVAAGAGAASPIYHLGGDGGDPLRPAVTLGQGLPPRVSDLPAHYYWKDAIRVGTYAHPSGRYTLGITRETLDGFARTFSAMRENGVGVPILMDHAPTAAATLGWIVAVKRDGDRLMELHQFLGDDARDVGLRNHVSLGIDPDFVDGRGVRYGRAIVHSAVTPVPVVPGQGEFQAVELAGVGREVVVLSRIGEMSPGEHRTSNIERPTSKTGNEEAAVTEPAPSLPPTPIPSPQSPTPFLIDAAAARRDLAVAAGGLAPHVAAELFALLVGTGDAAAPPPPIALARTGPAGDGPPVAVAVFDLLARNRPVTLGEQTGGQRLHALSRLVPVGDGGDEAVFRDDVRQRMIDLANGR